MEIYFLGRGWVPVDPTSYAAFGSLGKRKVLLTGIDRENKVNYRISWRGPAELKVYNQLIVYEQLRS